MNRHTLVLHSGESKVLLQPLLRFVSKLIHFTVPQCLHMCMRSRSCSCRHISQAATRQILLSLPVQQTGMCLLMLIYMLLT